MLFPTVEFAIYFPVVLAISWILMPQLAWWKIFIVVASYVFYGTANWKFCFLLGGVTLGNYLFARLIAGAPTQRRKKHLLAAIIALDLGTLGVFKYYAFFVEDVDRALNSIALGIPLPLLTIALPVGISFFIFQAITYVVDTYRGHVDPAPLLDVAVYLSFFSHLVAGPIVRASEFLPQINRPRDPADVAVGAGLFLIAVGLEEGGGRGLPGARGCGPRVRSARGAYGAGRHLRLVRLRRADLLRLLRLHGHGDRARALARDRLSAELQPPLPVAQLR